MYPSWSAASSSSPSMSIQCWPGIRCLLKHQEKRKNPSESASRSKILVQRSSWDWEHWSTHQTQIGRATRRRARPGRWQGRGAGTGGSEPSLAAAASSLAERWGNGRSPEASWLSGEDGTGCEARWEGGSSCQIWPRHEQLESI